MATVEQKRPKTGPVRQVERDPQVYHPLDRLRGIIRRYVIIEGVLSVLLFLSAWFALGLLFDFGLFKTLRWDWVRDGSWWLRLFALVTAVALLIGIVVFRIIRRLTREFSYPALALVLERRFPKLLGDRLITAVEMADVEQMGRYGYSKDMLRATIAEARERVGRVAVNEVFNWKRLWVMGFLSVGILLGTLLVSFASFAIATRSVDLHRFGWRFAHVTGIFLERNVALMNTPWPRQAHVELVGFPESGELTVGQNAPPPRVTARAFRWVMADTSVPEGWRPIYWSDVTDEFVGRRVPDLPFESLRVAGDTSPLPTEAHGWTLDTIENLVFEREDDTSPKEVLEMRAALKKKMNTKWGQDGKEVRDEKGEVVTTTDYEELQEVFKALNAKADQPSMGRTLRKLDLPAEVRYKYTGRRTAGGGTLVPQQNNEFAGEILGLKEDVQFVIRAADFETSSCKIRLIPPPVLKGLYRTQFEPAYLRHAAPQGEGELWFKGKLQQMAPKVVSLTGERSVFAVPAGTELILDAEAEESDNDQLISAVAIPVSGRFPGMKYDEKGLAIQTPLPLTLTNDGRRFSIEFKNRSAEYLVTDLKKPQDETAEPLVAGVAVHNALVRFALDHRLTENVEFRLTFTNKYNVTTTRTIVIQVAQDQPPTVDVAVDVIRKSPTNNFYLVTPKARIPFHPNSYVKDDHSVSKLEYVFTYWPEDTDYVKGLRASYALRSFLDIPATGPMFIPGLTFPIRHYYNFGSLSRRDKPEPSSVGLEAFVKMQAKVQRETPERVLALLREPMKEETQPDTVLKVELKNPDDFSFDLEELHRKGALKIAAPSGEAQPKYRMDLYIQATDNNVDAPGGPRMTRNAQPISLQVISESDLLVEIGLEEGKLGERLDDAIRKLVTAKDKYVYVRTTNGSTEATDTNVDSVKTKLQDALQDVEKARDILQSVVREYRRIHRECRINRVTDASTWHYGKMANWMDRILGLNPPSVSPDEDAQVAEGLWKGKTTFPDTQNLLTSVLQDLGKPPQKWAPDGLVTDAQISLNTLYNDLVKLREAIGEVQSREKLKRDLLKIKEQQELIRRQLEKMYAEWLEEVNSPTPAIGEVGPQFFAKGETKKIKHSIRWRQYPDDNVKVKVTADDPSIVVPPEMTLNFEKNELNFEYEVRAGNKDGEFKLTVTPAVGKPVEVQITVK